MPDDTTQNAISPQDFQNALGVVKAYIEHIESTYESDIKAKVTLTNQVTELRKGVKDLVTKKLIKHRELDKVVAEIAEKKASIDTQNNQRSVDLDARENKLNKDTIILTSKITEFNRKITEQESADRITKKILTAREETLSNQLEDIAGRESDIDTREEQLADGQNNLAIERDEVVKDRSDIKKRQDAVTESEAAIAKREAKLTEDREQFKAELADAAELRKNLIAREHDASDKIEKARIMMDAAEKLRDELRKKEIQLIDMANVINTRGR